MKNIEKQMQDLITSLNEASYHYYTLDNPIISDKEWDALYDSLLKLEKESGIVLENSPSKKVGGDTLSKFSPHSHLQRLYSMDKVQSLAELTTWLQKNKTIYDSYQAKNTFPLPPLEYSVEYKLDGLSLNLTYENGSLVQAATRGNGIIGESILQNALTIISIPRKISASQTMEVQGECIMRLSVLAEYNRTHVEQLKNARNAAAGALRNLDTKVTAERNLDAFFYAIGYNDSPDYHTQKELIDFLEQNRFSITPFFRICTNFEEISTLIAEIEERRERLDFLIDGVVIKINDLATRELFGYTDKFPKWAIAYKFEAEEATTKIKKVSWEVGRSGKLTPLAHLESVDIGGVSVSKATLNNYGDIQKKQVKIGSTVWIRRSNDVIPEILGRVDTINDSNEIEISLPTICPSCGRTLYQEGAHIFCPGGVDCEPQAVASLAHFASRDAMDIEGFSEMTALALYQKNLARTPDDIYKLNLDKLLSLDKVKEKKANNLLKAIENSKHRKLSQFIMALGIPNVGKKTGKDLSLAFASIELLRNASIEDLLKINEVGEVVAESIKNFFNDEEKQRMLDTMLSLGVQPESDASMQNNVLLNQSIVVTGTLPTLGRKEIEDLIEKNGGKVGSSVSKKTAFVVLGENPGSKYEKALALGVPIKTEEEFLAMLS